MNITTGQLEAWMAAWLWPFIRIGACLMVAPVFGAQFVPARFRIVLAAAITLLVAPLLPPMPDVSPFSGAGIVITVQQLIIGVAVGFVLQIVFDALAMGGQLLANTMGLSFAFNVDPLRGTGTPVLGQFYTLIATLTFLALNGHIAVIEAMVDGFGTMPIGTTGLGTEGMWQIALWGNQLFRGALMVALPGLTAPGIRCSQSRGAFIEPVCHRFPGDADRRSADRAGGFARRTVRLCHADARDHGFRVGPDAGRVGRWPKPSARIVQRPQPPNGWRMRAAMGAFRAHGI
jgi:flagellar biosynthesis protein FliR